MMDEAEPMEREARTPKHSTSSAGFAENGPESFTQVFAALKGNEGTSGSKSGSDNNNFKVATSSRLTDSQQPMERRMAPPSQIMEQERSPDLPKASFRYRDDNQPYSGASNHSGDGEFTKLLNRVSANASTMEEASNPPFGLRTDSRAATPSEFTRVVSQSMLRERSRLDDAQAAGATPSENNAVPNESLPVNSSSFVPIEHTPAREQEGHTSRPRLDPHAVLSNMRNVPGVARSTGPLDSPLVDSAKSAITTSSSPVGSSAISGTTAPGRLQEYVPFLLIANLFLTALLILLVSFAFLQH